MNIFKKIENAMIAATFAEAGEQEQALYYLGYSKNAHKKVLLVTDTPEIVPQSIDHSMSLCKRLGGSLEIFHLLSPKVMQTNTKVFYKAGLNHLSSLKERLAKRGISYQLCLKDSQLDTEVNSYASKRRDLLTVVISSGEETISKIAKGKLFNKFNCPVVVLDAN